MTLAGGMPVTLVHASSASALAQRPVRYLIFDEVSRFPVQSKGRVKEGDPLALGKVRQTTFGEDAKTVSLHSTTGVGAPYDSRAQDSSIKILPLTLPLASGPGNRWADLVTCGLAWLLRS